MTANHKGDLLYEGDIADIHEAVVEVPDEERDALYELRCIRAELAGLPKPDPDPTWRPLPDRERRAMAPAPR